MNQPTVIWRTPTQSSTALRAVQCPKRDSAIGSMNFFLLFPEPCPCIYPKGCTTIMWPALQLLDSNHGSSREFSLKSVLGISRFFMQIFLFFFYLNLSPVPLKNASNLCFGYVAPYIHIISKVDASEITQSSMNPLGHDNSKVPVFSHNISGIPCECVANILYCGPTLNQFPYPSDNGSNQSQHQSRKKLGDTY